MPAAGTGTESVGNVPLLSAEEQVKLLQARLREAVRREEFEEAAAFRDQIHKLKEETESHGEMV